VIRSTRVSRRFARELWRAYADGVVAAVNGDGPETGMDVSDRDMLLSRAARHGYHDAEQAMRHRDARGIVPVAHRVMSRYDFEPLRIVVARGER
jgi:hypothetical protein